MINKLALKIITDRLKQVMPSIVHSDQTCNVVGRSIFSNLHLIRDTLDMINKTDETVFLERGVRQGCSLPPFSMS